ncbi:hypothetical protein WMY93_003474 [Mugilogobius chulae]|uniref:C-type lectin domain-containing protein n=1 Tax=Mugilogobius chulae TaxID=88201 RepID=A0AAW0PWT1_9GOBI
MFYIAVGTLFLRRELHWDNVRQTWESAQSYCRQSHVDLVTITNQAETEMITYGWIGLYHSESQWRWSRGNLMANFTLWKSDNKHCAWKDGNYIVSDECMSDHTVNCVDEPLVLVRDNKTWEEALEYCRTLKIYPHSVQHYELTQLLSADHLHNAQDILQSANVLWLGLGCVTWETSGSGSVGKLIILTNSSVKKIDVQRFTMRRRVLLLTVSLLWLMEVTGQLIYVTESRSWADAQTYCRLYYVDLVTIMTEEENAQIVKDSWLGLYRSNSTAEWKWSKEDVPLTFRKTWKSTPKTDEHCAYKHEVITKNGSPNTALTRNHSTVLMTLCFWFSSVSSEEHLHQEVWSAVAAGLWLMGPGGLVLTSCPLWTLGWCPVPASNSAPGADSMIEDRFEFLTNRVFTMRRIGLLPSLSLLWVMRVRGQQFVYVDDSVNWAEAQTYCRQNHVDLVTVTTQAQNDRLVKDTWLGLYRHNSTDDWKWSQGDAPLTFTNTWHDKIEDDEHCIYKNAGDHGEWKSEKCTSNKKFYCVGTSIFLVSLMKTWEQALVYCRSLSTADRSYDLASLLTDEDHDYVRSIITDKVWTGLRFLGDDWVWAGGEEVQYDDIERCPVIQRKGLRQWRTEDEVLEKGPSSPELGKWMRPPVVGALMGRIVIFLSLLWVMGVRGQQTVIFVSKSLAWADAQTYCRQYFVDLVTIMTEEENNQINQKSWLGLYRPNSDADWKWSRGNQQLTFSSWKENHPVNGYNCAYKSDESFWRSVDCNKTYTFFCLDDSVFLVRQMKTWEQALVHCRSLSTADRSYDLASLITDEDHDCAKSLISEQVRSSGPVWIGLRFLGDSWVWVGAEKAQYDGIIDCPVRDRCGTVDSLTLEPYGFANFPIPLQVPSTANKETAVFTFSKMLNCQLKKPKRSPAQARLSVRIFTAATPLIFVRSGGRSSRASHPRLLVSLDVLVCMDRYLLPESSRQRVEKLTWEVLY